MNVISPNETKDLKVAMTFTKKSWTAFLLYNPLTMFIKNNISNSQRINF